jgi:Ca-activated chloride channel family protein
VLIGLGALVLGAVGAAFLTMGRSAPAHSAAEAPSAPQDQEEAGKLHREVQEADKKIKVLEGDLANAKDEAERARFQEQLRAAQGGKGTGAPRPAAPRPATRCSPGDPLCGDLDDLAPPPPPGAAATATASAAVAPEKPRGPRALDGEVALDPNGRFATTYRPGGGHLSAFEAAVSQGILPTTDRELVADVGARYAPEIEVPKGKALGLKLDWERAKLQPAGGPVHLRIALRSSAEAPAARPHLSVHLVLDVSGSMAGKPMEQARKAAQTLVDKLAATDDFSLVTFSTGADVVVPDGPVGARREQIKKTIEGIKEGGGTNIGEGLRLGYQQAHSKGIPEDAVKVVMLLSDGRANEGIVRQGQLAKLALDAFQEGIQTSSFGIGTDYDGPLMSAIGADGAGGYYYLRDSEQIAPALAAELDKRLDPVATAVEVRIRLKPEAQLLKVYGSRRLNEAEAVVVRTQEVAADKQAQQRDKIKENRATDQEGGMRFFMPAFARDDSHAMLLKLRLPEGVGSRPVALVEVKYKDRLAKKNASEEVPLTLAYATSDAESGGSIDPSVARTVQGFLAGEALAQASTLVAQGNRAEAAQMLAEREGILREAAASLREPLFLRDADRLARMQSQVRGKGEGAGDPLVLAMLLETAARVHQR